MHRVRNFKLFRIILKFFVELYELLYYALCLCGGVKCLKPKREGIRLPFGYVQVRKFSSVCPSISDVR